jgi:Predicted membrane protein
MKPRIPTRKLVVCAMIAAAYTALCLVLMPLSYGAVQVRAAEALTLLPVYSPVAIWGLSLGCALSNLVGFFSGANPLGLIDTLFGTAATLIAAVISYALRDLRLRGLPVAAAIPPILCNAVILGLEFTFLEMGGMHLGLFAFNAAAIALGQAVSCIGLGLPLVYFLDKSGVAKRFFTFDPLTENI